MCLEGVGGRKKIRWNWINRRARPYWKDPSINRTPAALILLSRKRLPQIDLHRQIRRGHGLAGILHLILALRILAHPTAIDIVAFTEVRMLFVDDLLLDHWTVSAHLEVGCGLIAVQFLDRAIDTHLFRAEIDRESIAAGNGFRLRKARVR